MSLFKKILGLKSEPAAPINTARFVRVTLDPLHRISFSTVGSIHKLSNISIGGMAVMHSAAKDWAINKTIEGALLIDEQTFAIEARVRHLGSALAGCEFVGENREIKRAIESYLKVEILALNLRPVDEAYLKADPRGKVQWFTDGKQNEFYCVYDDNGVVAFHMSFLGTYVEGGRGLPIRAGSVQVQQSSAKHKGSELLDLVSSPTHETLKLADVFVKNIARLAPQIRLELATTIAA